MKRVARTLEVSLAAYSPSAGGSDDGSHQAELKSRPGIEGVIVAHLDAFARDHPNLAKKALSGLSQAIAGVSYIGNGAQASVYRKDNTVLKVYRATAAMDTLSREIYRQERQTRCDTLGLFLGSMATPQIFATEQHPLGDYQVVIGRQPFVVGDRLDLFRTNSLEIMATGLENYCERQQQGKDQLLSLVNAAFDSDDTSGLVPDLNGTDNFRLTGINEMLRLIDMEPVTRSKHPDVHSHILRQADTLAAFLERV